MLVLPPLSRPQSCPCRNAARALRLVFLQGFVNTRSGLEIPLPAPSPFSQRVQCGLRGQHGTVVPDPPPPPPPPPPPIKWGWKSVRRCTYSVDRVFLPRRSGHFGCFHLTAFHHCRTCHHSPGTGRQVSWWAGQGCKVAPGKRASCCLPSTCPVCAVLSSLGQKKKEKCEHHTSLVSQCQ